MKPINSDWQNSCSTIQDSNLHLLKSGKFSDVVFLVGETKIPVHAHKLILMSRSSVFETMFERWETGEKCTIEIPETTHQSFQLFLEYLYSNTFSVTEEDASDVLYLAHKYNSNDLVKLCSDILKSVIGIGNVFHIHLVASRLDQVDLRTLAMDFILRNAKWVFQTIGFLEIDSDTLSTILKDNKLATDELTIFRAVMRWAEYKCEKQELGNTMKNKRTILRNLIHLIRFPLMTNKDFTDEVVRKNKGILTDAETIAIYMDFSTEPFYRSNFPAIPFNRNRRYTPDVYRVEPYTVRRGYFQDLNCRGVSGTLGGTKYRCVSTLIFSSSGDISLSGIELHGFQGSNHAGGGGEGSSVSSEFAMNSEFSVSIKPRRGSSSTESRTRVTPKQLKELFAPSSVKIEFDREISLQQNDQYEIKFTYIGGGDPSGRVEYKCRGEPCKSAKVNCGGAITTFTFHKVITECGRQSSLGYDPCPICLSSGQIRAIFFTL